MIHENKQYTVPSSRNSSPLNPSGTILFVSLYRTSKGELHELILDAADNAVIIPHSHKVVGKITGQFTHG